MNVFVTGATGWVGSRVVQELLTAGHQVLGLARSEDKAAGLARTGARVLHATLDDLGPLAEAARQADAVIHLAFNHDFSKFADNARQDQRAIEVLGEALAGTDKPLLVTSGLARLTPGRVPTEADLPVDHPDYPRRSETTAIALAERGVRVATVRLPPTVHGVGDSGFVPFLIRLAREKGVSAYLGEGTNRWSAVHVSDAGRLYRLALERGVSERAYHAVAEQGVALRDIAHAIGRRLGVPVESRGREHFGWLANFALSDMPAASERTRAVLGWQPTGPTLLADLEHPDYCQT